MFKRAAADTRTIKALLEGAETHARDLGDQTPGPEHLLLSSLDLEDGSAREVLAVYGVGPDDVRAAIDRSHADALGTTGPSEVRAVRARAGVFHGTGTLREAFQRAAELARADKVFRGAHVVIAVAELRHGTSARALDRLGIPHEELIEAARRTLTA